MEQIKLDIIPKGLMPTCHASQYDKGRVIRLNLMDGLQGYSLTDETVVLNVRKPDNNIVTTNVDITQGNSYVDIVTTEQMTACEGDNLCELVINKGDVRIASLNFRMRVEVDPLKDGIESETEIHNLETQIQAINDAIVPEMIADQYDSSNVIFDDEPTENHGIGYAVTSKGIKNAITNVQNDIEEVNDKADTNATAISTINDNIGDLSDLTTTVKSSIVGAVNEVNKYETDTYNVSTYGGTIICQKWGRLVNIQANNIGTVQALPSGASYTLTSIASKYCPANSLRVVGMANAGSYQATTNSQSYSIGSDGRITTYAYTAPSIANGVFNITFLV